MTILLSKHTRQLLLLIALLALFLSACAAQKTTPAATPPVKKSTAVPETAKQPTRESTAENKAKDPTTAASPTSAPTPTAAPATPGSTVIEFNSAQSNKFSSMTKFNLLEANLEPTAELNLLLRTDGELNARQLKQLEEAGTRIRTAAGDIITVTTTAERLNDIAALDFVVYIELSAPLYPEN